MPATEQTWRDQKKLHFLFAITGSVLFIATIWMFLKDHNRQWKEYQSQAKHILLEMEEWRKLQLELEAKHSDHGELQEKLALAKAQGVPLTLYNQFKDEVNADLTRRENKPTQENFASADRLVSKLNGENPANKEIAAAIVAARDKLPEDKRAKFESAMRALGSGEGGPVAERIELYDGSAGSLAMRIAGEARVAADRQAVAKDRVAQYQQLEKDLSAAIVDADNAERALQAATGIKKPELQKDFDAKKEKLDKAKKSASEAGQAAAQAKTLAGDARKAATGTRENLLAHMQALVLKAKFREDTLLDDRKGARAQLDKANADEGLIIRDFTSQGEEALKERVGQQQQIIEKYKLQAEDLNLRYEPAKAHRLALQTVVKQITADETALDKEIKASNAAMTTVNKAITDRRSTFLVWWNGVPLPGKRWLEMPILDAFNSPLKIENNWSDQRTIDYNFADVKRYDRCTTCHQMMEKSQPGSADQPGFVKEQYLTLIVTPPAKSDKQPQGVEELYGITILPDGLAERGAVSIGFVREGSLASQARLKLTDAATSLQTGADIREAVMKGAASDDHQVALEVTDNPNPFAPAPGLRLGDVLVDVDGSMVRSAEEAERFFSEGAARQKPLHVRVRRGLKNPFNSHPRLDLFVGSTSPHKLQEFGCTTCHDGQGSATDFKWASHTPNSIKQMEEWSREYGWFDNHHWIYPMNAQRFAEASCIKCHHEVVDLEPSQRFPEPPAPTVVRGYNVIRKYGCYGCHEINGFDGPNKRVGPDLRLEPNHFAAAQQLKADANYDKLDSEVKSWVDTVVDHPERAEARARLVEFLQADQQKDPVLTAQSHNLAPLLKDVEAPGSLRKPGPSLRYSKAKMDESFMFDWISNPKHFRPSTRMPQVFGLHKHLEGKGLEVAEKYEPLEVAGITAYLQDNSQKFEYLTPPASVTAPASAERGKLQFQTRGCLACHSHGEFADAEAYRGKHEIVQGPDLSGVAEKFSPERNPDGRKWLYSWIKEPTRYHKRTVMPNLFLDPMEVTENEKAVLVDPAADIVEFLMASKAGSKDYKPKEPQPLDEKALGELLFGNLRDVYAVRIAAQYAGMTLDEKNNNEPVWKASNSSGIPASSGEVKGAEALLIVGEGSNQLTNDQKLKYIGRKAITKYGCYGCHDIPGFEDAKPIGAGLNDWGRKEPAKLAFEHIVEYLEHHGGGHHEAKKPGEEVKHDHAHEPEAHKDSHEPKYPEYLLEQVLHGNRIGFLYQKLREPRSYDFEKTENKKYNERLRMPQFSLSDEDRQAVMTFVLGLVADPPGDKFMPKPNERQRAIVEGQKVLEKYNCQSCHILQAAEWTVSMPKDFFGKEQLDEEERKTHYPFLLNHVSPEAAKASLKTDRRGLETVKLSVMPRLEANDGKPSIATIDEEPLTAEEKYDPTKTRLYFDLWKPAVIGGQPYLVGIKPMNLPREMIDASHLPQGGFLTRYLIPTVTKIDAAQSGAAKGQESMAWLPPPLIGEGEKVQSDWLHDFLLDPYPIRPAVFLRMPRFNMTSEEAQKLTAYFAAVDNASYPYNSTHRRQEGYLSAEESKYQAVLGQANAKGNRLDDALKIVTSNNYCVKCHIVGNFTPGMGLPTKPSPRSLAPDLTRVYQRLRPDYVREWVANPKVKLPYTAMPVNIPYDKGVAQELYHGTSTEQLDGLVDLLMNFDQYSKQKTDIAAGVKEAPATPPAETTPPATNNN